MVQILIRMSENPGEWGLVELQGQLETRNQVPFDNMHIGDLHFDAKGDPNLVVGHHLLTGKITELEKPFAVMRKRTGGGLDRSHRQTEYEIVALITKKMIFKNRPKPIITKTQPRKVT